MAAVRERIKADREAASMEVVNPGSASSSGQQLAVPPPPPPPPDCSTCATVDRRLTEFITRCEVRQVELESQKVDLYQQVQARAIEAELQQAEITQLLQKYEGAVEKIGLLEGQVQHFKANQRDYMMRFATVCSTVEKHQSQLKEWSDWSGKGQWKDSHRGW
jgi:hypothetical protein